MLLTIATAAFWVAFVCLGMQWGLFRVVVWIAMGALLGGMVGDAAVLTWPELGEAGGRLISAEVMLAVLAWFHYQRSRRERQRRRI